MVPRSAANLEVNEAGIIAGASVNASRGI